MSRLTGLLRFLWEFFAGDTLALPLGVGLTLLACGAAAKLDQPHLAHLLLPAGVMATIIASLRRAP